MDSKTTTKLFVNITLKDESCYQCPVDSVEFDAISLSVYVKQGGLNFEYKDIKSIAIGVYHDEDLLTIEGTIVPKVEREE